MNAFEQAWYQNKFWVKLLWPISSMFRFFSQRRRNQYSKGGRRSYQAKIPVIVVGNITVGGTGKTPLVIYLAQQLNNAGYQPGIVSRGYLSKAKAYPFVVTPNSKPEMSGDEPLLIAKNTGCPVIIDPDRVAAVKKLENDFNCDVIISDDGLQHYAMARNIEIAVIDGGRGLGNGLLLPAGPLRELPERLKEVDFVISNGPMESELPVESQVMKIKLKHLCNLSTGKKLLLNKKNCASQKVHALAGIGNPERFFNSLCDCGFDIISHVYPDHHNFTQENINFGDELKVVMTEKDALKCQSFANDKHWFLKIEAELGKKFINNLIKKLQSFNPV